MIRNLLLLLWIECVFIITPIFAQRVWVCGDLEKVNPITGGLISDGTYSSTTDNSLKSKNLYWDQTDSTIFLSGAGNEIVAFQIIIERTDKDLSGIWLECSDLVGPDQNIIRNNNFEIFREWYVSKDNVNYPEVLISFELKQDLQPFLIPDPDFLKIKNNNQALWIDLFIPHHTPAGKYTGKITINGNGFSPIDLAISLTVWNFTLPNKQNYDYEMNIYGGLENHFEDQNQIPINDSTYLEFEANTYRLCHKNRLTFLIIPYRQSGDPSTYLTSSMRPVISDTGANIHVESWDEWDARFGKYFDGSTFTDLYRSGTPIAHFTLPYNHNWPSDWTNFVSNPDEYPYWGKNIVYEKENILIAREFEKHFNKKGWTKTLFYIFYNEKKKWGFIRWHLDEPIKIMHYEAHRYYSQIMHSGFKNTLRSFEYLGDANKDVSFPYPDSAKFLYRLDIGRHNLVIDYLDGWIDLWNVGGWHGDGTHNYVLKDLHKRMEKGDHYMVYGPWSFKIEDYNLIILWTGWNDWKRRTTGHEIWRTNDWPNGITSDWNEVVTGTRVGECTYYYPGSNIGINQPLPSIRMKMIRRTVQDWEYLYYLTQLNNGDKKFADDIVNSFMDSEDMAFAAETAKYNLTAESFLRAREIVAKEIENIILGSENK